SVARFQPGVSDAGIAAEAWAALHGAGAGAAEWQTAAGRLRRRRNGDRRDDRQGHHGRPAQRTQHLASRGVKDRLDRAVEKSVLLEAHETEADGSFVDRDAEDVPDAMRQVRDRRLPGQDAEPLQRETTDTAL